MPDTSDEAEIERRIRARQEQQALKDQVGRNTEAVAQVRAEMTDKLERAVHNIVEQISERWDDKVELLETRLERKMDTQTNTVKDEVKAAVADLLKRIVLKEELPDEVERQVERILENKTNHTRSAVQFYARTTLWIVSIMSGVGTFVFWIWQMWGAK